MGDHGAGMSLAGGIAAALFERERTGRGQLVTTSLLRQGIYTLSFDLSIASRFGTAVGVADRRKMGNPAINCYQDADGRWFAKVSNRVFVTFSDDGSGGAGELRLHERLRMRRTATPDEVPRAAPAELVPYLGTYHLAKARADFTVLYHQGALGLHQPGAGRILRLEPAGGQRRWVDEHGRYLRFETGEKGTVSGLTMESITGTAAL